jgi:hypothetical protein
MTEINEDAKRALAIRELEAAQEGIHTYGKIQFTIKGWAITVFAAFLGVSANNGNWQLLIPCVFALLLFWALDSIYKVIQLAYISRARVLETYLQGGQTTDKLLIPDTENSIDKQIEKTCFCKTLVKPRVMLLYLMMLIIIACVPLYKALRLVLMCSSAEHIF